MRTHPDIMSQCSFIESWNSFMLDCLYQTIDGSLVKDSLSFLGFFIINSSCDHIERIHCEDQLKNDEIFAKKIETAIPEVRLAAK
jgi:hypothetical protein